LVLTLASYLLYMKHNAIKFTRNRQLLVNSDGEQHTLVQLNNVMHLRFNWCTDLALRARDKLTSISVSYLSGDTLTQLNVVSP
jgi:hypothetical protein